MEQKPENTQETQNTPAPAAEQPKKQEAKQIFRQESIDRISSPEQLTDYLRVTNPSTWLILAAVIILLAGMFVWACVGYLETKIKSEDTEVRSGQIVMLVPAKNAESMKEGQTVRVNGTESTISQTVTDEYGRTYAYASTTLPDGSYTADIVTEKLNPISFMFH